MVMMTRKLTARNRTTLFTIVAFSSGAVRHARAHGRTTEIGHFFNEWQHARLELGVVERDEDVEAFILGGDAGRLE
jgi:hypothetical protein